MAVGHISNSDGDTIIAYTCESSSFSWAVGMYVIEAILLVYGAKLSWETSRVPSKFRESKHIALSIWYAFDVQRVAVFLS